MVQKSWVGETKITHLRTNCSNIKIAFHCFATSQTLECLHRLDYTHLHVLMLTKRDWPQIRVSNIARHYSEPIRGAKTLKKWSKSHFDQRARQWLNNLQSFFFFLINTVLREFWKDPHGVLSNDSIAKTWDFILKWIYWRGKYLLGFINSAVFSFVFFFKKGNHGTSLVVQ